MAVEKNFRSIVELLLPRLYNFILFSSEGKKGLFNFFLIEKAIIEKTSRERKISKCRMELLKNEGEADVYDELNNELNSSTIQYTKLKTL